MMRELQCDNHHIQGQARPARRHNTRARQPPPSSDRSTVTSSSSVATGSSGLGFLGKLASGRLEEESDRCERLQLSLTSSLKALTASMLLVSGRRRVQAFRKTPPQYVQLSPARLASVGLGSPAPGASFRLVPAPTPHSPPQRLHTRLDQHGGGGGGCTTPPEWLVGVRAAARPRPRTHEPASAE